MSLSAGCLFSGMGGMASGLIAAGFEIRWANDNDPNACNAFRHRFPDVALVEKDVRELSVTKDRLSPVDILAAGFPCQSFSQAGSRGGFKDPRGKLFFEIPRLLAEFSIRPRLLVFENVPNLLYGADGEWFQTIRKELREAGYWFRDSSCWTVNVKDATDIPQDRERLFMIAASRDHFSYNPFTAPSVSPSRRSLDSIIDRSKEGDPGAYLPTDNRYYRMIDQAMNAGSSKQNLYHLRRSYVREKKGGLCPTLTANMGNGGHNVPFVRDPWGIRRLSIAEVAQLQGFHSEDLPEMLEKDKYRLLGNAVCVKLASLVAGKCVAILREAT